MIDQTPEGPRGVISAYIALNARPYQQEVQLALAPYRAFNQRGRLDQPRYPKAEPWKLCLLPMPMSEFYAYLLLKKLVTPIFAKPRDSPFLLGFDSSKKC